MNTRLALRPEVAGASPTSDRDARLAALAARRGPSPVVGTSEREAVEARLAALSARRPAGARPAATATGRTTPSSGGRSKRRHAAKGARVASLGLSIVSTGALAGFFAMSSGGTGSQVQAATIVAGPIATATAVPTPTIVDLTVVPAADQQATAQAAVTAPAVPSPASTVPVTVPVAVPAADTVVQGGVFNNKWGDVQVQATFASDGSIVDVVVLQAPDRDGKSVRINDRAVPVLNSEALTVQSANVDTVSGATYTSNDYQRSLQSAIDVAREAGLTALA